MTTKQLKKKIKNKFGTLAKFAKLIGREPYDLQKFFAAADKKMTPERLAEMIELNAKVGIIKNNPVSTDLTPELRKKIKETIIEKHGGVTEFCDTHPDFSAFSVWQMINGRRKTISAAVKKLLNLLEIQ